MTAVHKFWRNPKAGGRDTCTGNHVETFCPAQQGQSQPSAGATFQPAQKEHAMRFLAYAVPGSQEYEEHRAFLMHCDLAQLQAYQSTADEGTRQILREDAARMATKRRVESTGAMAQCTKGDQQKGMIHRYFTGGGL